MRKRIRIACLFNKVTSATIGLENFAQIDDARFEKHVVVLKQSRVEAQACVKALYSRHDLTVHSVKDLSPRTFPLHKIWSTGKLLAQIKPDIVHAHHAFVAMASAFNKARLGYWFLTTAHSNFHYYTYVQKLCFSYAFRKSDCVICNSRNTSISLPSFIRGGARRTIYNGVNFDAIRPNGRLTQKENTVLNIGTVCRMVPAKDIGTLIRGFAILANKSFAGQLKLILVGEGPELEGLRNLAASLGLQQTVVFTGALMRTDAYRRLEELDIFVVSSRWEGFCNAMVEAAAARKAIIATEIEPLPEILGRENALFFRPGDHRGLSEQLAWLIRSPELREELAGRAFEFVRERYSLQRSLQAHEDTYLQLVEGRAG